MNRCIKAGLTMAVPHILALPFVWVICGIGYFVNIQIDPSSDGLFFYHWALSFTIIFSLLAVVCFIFGAGNEYRNVGGVLVDGKL